MLIELHSLLSDIMMQWAIQAKMNKVFCLDQLNQRHGILSL
jgi:hypothetical protein